MLFIKKKKSAAYYTGLDVYLKAFNKTLIFHVNLLGF